MGMFKTAALYFFGYLLDGIGSGIKNAGSVAILAGNHAAVRSGVIKGEPKASVFHSEVN